MKVTIDDIGPCKKRLTVEVGPDAVKAEMEEHLGEAMAHAQLPGFRRGKAPRAMLEKRFGTQLAEEARDHLMGHSFRDAVKEHKLEPLGEPNVETVDFDPAKGLRYVLTLEVRPEFTLPALSAIKLARKEAKVTDADLDAACADLRKQHGEWTPAEGAALKAGDLAVCTLTIKEGEKTAWERADLGVVLDDNPIGELPTGPTAKLLDGHKAGETRQMVATLPEGFSREDLRGKMVTLVVKVQEVRHERLPDLDDAFAKTLGVESLAALKEQMKGHLLRRKEHDAHRQVEEDLVTQLIEKTAFELPQDALAAQAQDALRRATVDLLMQGVPEDQVKGNLEKIQAGSKTWAERRLRSSLILAKFAEKEKVFVTESDVEDRVRGMAAAQGQRPEAVLKHLEEQDAMGNLRASIREAKVLDLLLTKVKVEAKTAS